MSARMASIKTRFAATLMHLPGAFIGKIAATYHRMVYSAPGELFKREIYALTI